MRRGLRIATLALCTAWGDCAGIGGFPYLERAGISSRYFIASGISGTHVSRNPFLLLISPLKGTTGSSRSGSTLYFSACALSVRRHHISLTARQRIGGNRMRQVASRVWGATPSLAYICGGVGFAVLATGLALTLLVVTTSTNGYSGSFQSFVLTWAPTLITGGNSLFTGFVQPATQFRAIHGQWPRNTDVAWGGGTMVNMSVGLGGAVSGTILTQHVVSSVHAGPAVVYLVSIAVSYLFGTGCVFTLQLMIQYLTIRLSQKQ